MYKISLDIMGAELGYKIPLKAAYKFCKIHKDVKFFFTGDENKIKSFLTKLKFPKENFVVINTTQVITLKDGITAIRRKKDSSMIKAIELVKNDECDIVISGGSSSVFLASCHLILKEMKGIDKPAFMCLIPNIANSATIFLDVGANIQPKINDLINYSYMATVYAKEILNIKNPITGLLNIGEEETKGHDFHRDLNQALQKDSSINFYGNIEPRYMFSNNCHILLTDGFSGNLILKTLEGTAMTILKIIKKEFTKNIFSKIRSLFIYSLFKNVKNKFNYKKYNGALIIGLNKPAFKTHGSSDEYSYFSVIQMAYKNLKNDVLNKIKEEIQNEKKLKNKHKI